MQNLVLVPLLFVVTAACTSPGPPKEVSREAATAPTASVNVEPTSSTSKGAAGQAGRGAAPSGAATAPPDRRTPPAGSMACTSDADCRTYSSYCGEAPCACLPLGKSASNPRCSGPAVNCFVDPCRKKIALCKAGSCVLQPPAAERTSSSMMSDPSFGRAEALLAASNRRWVAVSGKPTPVRWSSPDVAFREYRTQPDSQASVFVYVFKTPASAAAAAPEIQRGSLDGVRSRVVHNHELVFVVESPTALPGRSLPSEVGATFDATVTSVSRP